MNYKKIIIQWLEFNLPKPFHRQIPVPLDHDFVITITGPRRAGKTYLCFQLMYQLIEKGIKKENMLYVNFEDEKILGANARDLDKILDMYYELGDINKKKNIYLFLDEIQNVDNWDVWVRRIHEMYKNIKIILTGSSSKLLSKEISTKLRGMVLNTEVFPLSFKEYLDWKNIQYSLSTLTHSQKRFAVKKAFSFYLSNGGYPALLTSQPLRDDVLQSYFQSIIFKDIIERYNIKEVKKLEILGKLLFESTSKEISYNRLANKLRSLGFDLSKNTIIEYISYFEDAYLFFQNLKYEYSLTKQLGSIKKVYCIDNGLLNAVSFKFSEDIGKLLENMVFIELRRRNKQVYFYKKQYECDFLIQEKNKIVDAIQVTKELHDDNYKREINGLKEALKAYNLKQGTIVTYDLKDEKKVDGMTIKIVPVWEWLLG